MDPKTVNEIMSQGATHAETPQERREREQLEADLESSPVRGQPLPQRLRNFRPDPTSGVQALGGPTAWMRRLRAIEDAVEQHELRLGEAWQALAEEVEDPLRVERLAQVRAAVDADEVARARVNR